ncbi:MAG: histidine phosphatase family protein, partial [Oscillospiraceae bacterium]|nr:histidine phosphatase family protein [Oscillospiraceae bacterium]
MTNVYLIRHAEAEGNIYRRVHGHYDSHLTVRGRLQIDALVKRFKDVKLDEIYSSDLTRAKKTAEPIAQDHKLTVHIYKTLRECALGVWEDVTWGNVEWMDPEQYNYYLNDPAKWNCTGCARFYPLQRRLNTAILDLAAENDG